MPAITSLRLCQQESHICCCGVSCATTTSRVSVTQLLRLQAKRIDLKAILRLLASLRLLATGARAADNKAPKASANKRYKFASNQSALLLQTVCCFARAPTKQTNRQNKLQFAFFPLSMIYFCSLFNLSSLKAKQFVSERKARLISSLVAVQFGAAMHC